MPLPTLDFRNTNSLWCSVLAETLARLGVRHVVTSPGSRSVPLTFACAAQPAIEAIPVLDERAAAFFALGLAKQHGQPVALVCTSGTAAANYLPAVIEAHESGVPLLVFTADRPPEMRACSSGQTIDQQKIYGGFVRFYHEFAVPEARLELLRYLRQTLAHAVHCAVSPDPGPVHLNCPFRDPLPPLQDDSASGLKGGQLGEEFFAHLAPPVTASVTVSPDLLPRAERGLIIAGPYTGTAPAAYAAQVQRMAAALGWPVLADALSPLRHFPAAEAVIVAHYDAVLRVRAVAEKLRPEQVLVLEGLPTSKVLRAWLAALSGVPVRYVTARAANPDALHGAAIRLPGSVAAWADALAALPARRSAYTAAWQHVETVAAASLHAGLKATHELFEGKAVAILQRALPVGTPVCVANSMPVRDLEYFAVTLPREWRVSFNRGANGIDGTLSTALGVAHGNRPTVLLTGDLALLHDASGLLLRAKLRGSLTVVLINNAGGGIFEHLPVAQFDPPFEEFVATPQTVSFNRLCAAYGVEHTLITSWEQLVDQLSVLPATGVRVLEIPTDRKRDAATRKRLLATAAEAVEWSCTH
ncbi:MAG: 2-succinyl-5-enolpyruvyl-6-hydroxy-3-cyclohexene-1-carboxylic-acid synthase [Opitutae bacterium]|nr:2-succinyl-5-enolpyruvyl-6-hydroxy-3-cyclohexene-1-carboxylic-acid synthase [Opitutae bacterium]